MVVKLKDLKSTLKPSIKVNKIEMIVAKPKDPKSSLKHLIR